MHARLPKFSFSISTFAMLVCLALPNGVGAAPKPIEQAAPTEIITPPAPSRAADLLDLTGAKITLAHLLGSDTPIILKGGQAEMTLTVPVAQLVEVKSATLSLRLLPSAALSEDSWLTLRLNDLMV
ncbi:MAG: cellulose biosynthesis cyclic di-GMP-binding regulatory protein BcsB, partial [Halothiobacillus sp.]